MLRRYLACNEGLRTSISGCAPVARRSSVNFSVIPPQRIKMSSAMRRIEHRRPPNPLPGLREQARRSLHAIPYRSNQFQITAEPFDI